MPPKYHEPPYSKPEAGTPMQHSVKREIEGQEITIDVSRFQLFWHSATMVTYEMDFSIEGTEREKTEHTYASIEPERRKGEIARNNIQQALMEADAKLMKHGKKYFMKELTNKLYHAQFNRTNRGSTSP